MPTLALVAVAAVATGASYFEQKKAARKTERFQDRAQASQEKANKISKVQGQVESARSRRVSIAQARMAQARNRSAVASGSVQSSSALSGVNSGIFSQLGSNLGAQSQSLGSQQASFDSRQQGSNFMTDARNATAEGNRRAGAFQSIGNLAQFGAGNFNSGFGADT
jgi:hypothetical protein